jgi:ferric-dicitrate binding protein FerR (iron transport regulator)
MFTAKSTQNDDGDSGEKLPPEIDDLLRKNRVGTIAPEEQQRLEEYLKKNRRALRHYLSLCAIEGMIPSVLEMRERRDRLPDAANIIPFARSWKFAFLASVSALVLLAGAVVYSVRGPAQTQVAEPGWRIANVFGTSYKNVSFLAESRTEGNVFAIDSGVAELVLGKGTRVLLEAPASVEITGSNSCRLNYGKAVVDVPTSAIGFTMDSPHNRIVDHGTRFAVDATPGRDFTFVGVLSGIVDVEQGENTVRLYTDYAVEQSKSAAISVPLDRGEFITEMPSREFAWNLDGTPLGVPQTLSFDVTPLMRLPGNEISIIYKWLTGENAIWAKTFRLECDGEVVQELQVDSSRSGNIGSTFSNHLTFKLPAELKPGKRWQMQVTVLGDYPPAQARRSISSRGVFLFEKNLLKNADYSKFVGRWAYSHNGSDWVREFNPDGTWRLFINGREHVGSGKTDLCMVEDGVLMMHFTDPSFPVEKAVLRDDGTLIFLNRPYRNAVRIR